MEKIFEKIRIVYFVGILFKGKCFELLYVKMRLYCDYEIVL